VQGPIQTWLGVLLPQLEQFVPRSRQAQPAPNPATQSTSVLHAPQTAGPLPQNMEPLTVVWQAQEVEPLQCVTVPVTQKSVPAAQVPGPEQTPLLQASAARQIVAHVPQWLSSVLVSVQAPPQQTAPPVQAPA
jgi:hypothetical protein